MWTASQMLKFFPFQIRIVGLVVIDRIIIAKLQRIRVHFAENIIKDLYLTHNPSDISHFNQLRRVQKIWEFRILNLYFRYSFRRITS
jgi:hypothetical protein